MEFQIILEPEMTPETDRRIRDLLCLCFPADAGTFSTTRAWHGSAPAWSLIAETEGGLAGHVGIVDRLIRVGNEPVRVAGIQNACVAPHHRGKGLGVEMMTNAMAKAAIQGFDVGLLFCVPKLERVYVTCGWSTLPQTAILRMDADGSCVPLPAKNIAMCHLLNVDGFPAGDMHLNGNDW